MAGFTVAPAAGTVAALNPAGQPGWEAGGAALAAAAGGVVLVLTRRPAQARTASAAGLFVAAAGAARTALVATSARWALLTAGVTAAVALVIAVAPGLRGPRTDNGFRRAAGPAGGWHARSWVS